MPDIPQRVKNVAGRPVPIDPAACEPHTPHPDGQADHLQWQTEMMRTHDQRQCKSCGLWAIWEPKESAGGNDGRGGEAPSP